MNLKKILIAVLIATAVALILTFGIYKHNQATHDAAVRSASHSWQYLAAAKDIADGERVEPDAVMVVTSTIDQPVVGAFGYADRAKVIGRIASYPMSNGMIFTENYLARPDSSLGLPHKIPSGMRAFSIKTNEVNDLGGFLYPGTKVDVLVAVKGNDKISPRSVSLVQDVEVLASGSQLSPDPSGKPSSAKVVTVLVTPAEARKIALAQDEGTIYFSLRNGGDNNIEEGKPTLLTEITGTTEPSTNKQWKPLASVAPFPSAGTAVETVLGVQSTTQMFHGNLPVSSVSATRTSQSNKGVE